MKQNIYTIQDIKADYHNNPFVASNDETAKRNVQQALQGESQLSAYPEDFRLFKNGKFNTTTGVIEAEETPIWICNLTELVKKGN